MHGFSLKKSTESKSCRVIEEMDFSRNNHILQISTERTTITLEMLVYRLNVRMQKRVKMCAGLNGQPGIGPQY